MKKTALAIVLAAISTSALAEDVGAGLDLSANVGVTYTNSDADDGVVVIGFSKSF